MNTVKHERVFTPLGKGRIVYELPSRELVVEFEHGSGHIFRPEEVFRPAIVSKHLHNAALYHALHDLGMSL